MITVDFNNKNIHLYMSLVVVVVLFFTISTILVVNQLITPKISNLILFHFLLALLSLSLIASALHMYICPNTFIIFCFFFSLSQKPLCFNFAKLLYLIKVQSSWFLFFVVILCFLYFITILKNNKEKKTLIVFPKPPNFDLIFVFNILFSSSSSSFCI